MEKRKIREVDDDHQLVVSSSPPLSLSPPMSPSSASPLFQQYLNSLPSFRVLKNEGDVMVLLDTASRRLVVKKTEAKHHDKNQAVCMLCKQKVPSEKHVEGTQPELSSAKLHVPDTSLLPLPDMPSFESRHYFSLLEATELEVGARQGIEWSDEENPDSEAGKAAKDAKQEEGSREAGAGKFPSITGYYARFFIELRKLGTGGFGGVFLCTHALDNLHLGTYAIKKIPIGVRSRLDKVLSEVRTLERIRHANIVNYKHTWLEKHKLADFGPEVTCLFVLMEYADMGTLADLIWPPSPSIEQRKQEARRRRRKKSGDGFSEGAHGPNLLSEEDVWGLFSQCVKGVKYLHELGILHRDLKPDNLLLASRLRAPDQDNAPLHRKLRVLVSDFGESQQFGGGSPRTGNTGTVSFTAPEVLEREDVEEVPRKAYTQACDLWSLGVVLFAMSFGRLPFLSQEPDQLWQEIHSSSSTSVVPQPYTAEAMGRSPPLLALIRSLLSPNPSKRPNLSTLAQLLDLTSQPFAHPETSSPYMRPSPLFPAVFDPPTSPLPSSSHSLIQSPSVNPTVFSLMSSRNGNSASLPESLRQPQNASVGTQEQVQQSEILKSLEAQVKELTAALAEKDKIIAHLQKQRD